MELKYILEYSKWTSSASDPGVSISMNPKEISDPEDTPSGITYSYKSGSKNFYGTHQILVSFEGKTLPMNAKFDTGARTSSLDINSARKLGVSEDIIAVADDLSKIKIEKDITKEGQQELEETLFKEYSEKYPGISSIQLIKSSSGFTVRLLLKMSINFDGRIIYTDVNLKDRSGMSAEMLVGLKDLL